MGVFDVECDLTEIDEDLVFHYLHPLGAAELVGESQTLHPSLRVFGDVVLRFGFVEGDAVVAADRAVYDPQNPAEVLRFAENGSTANKLAIVLNQVELMTGVGKNGAEGARELMTRCGAEIVVVKGGPQGALVVDSTSVHCVPAYRSDSIFKIGSGDVFSAVFAQMWGERRYEPAAAADLASRAVSRYVETRNVQVDLELLDERVAVPSANARPIYLAGPFFTLSQRWIVEEARRCLEGMGCRVFSPVHDVGSDGGPVEIAEADLKGLKQCGSVIALVDGEDAGTLFEIGYARKLGLPVVALAESPRPEALTMLLGTGCQVVSDFTTAIYQSAWASMQ